MQSKQIFPLKSFCALLALLLLLPACTTTVSVGKLDVPVPIIPGLVNQDRDFRGLSWSGAFNAAIIQMQQEYAYHDWKNINWEELRTQFKTRIEEAEATQNDWAYYMALRDFASSFQDGLVGLPPETGYKRRDIGGGYGLSVVPLEDKRIMVTSVDTGRHSLQEGIKPGAILHKINKKPAYEVLQNTSILWATTFPATKFGERMHQSELIMRDPIGSTSTVTYTNPGLNKQATTKLTAILDEGDNERGTINDGDGLIDFATPFSSKIVNNIGYIKAHFLSATIAMPFPARAFQNHLKRIMEENVDGLILDLRGNYGGDSKLTVKIMGHFVTKETFYRDLAYRDGENGDINPHYDERISVSPDALYFNAPLVVLVDHETFGAAESLAYALHKLPDVKVVGFSASHGTADVPTKEVIMPGSYHITYPVARAIDEAGKVIIASAKDGSGGVIPDVLVPLNFENAKAFYINNEDVVLNAAIRYMQVRN